MAVTGFNKDEITVEVDQNELVIKAESRTPNESTAIEYIHRGLAARDIEKRFGLTEHMEVGDAVVANGLLTVYIKLNIPEAPKPRQIEVKG
jgi:molecular chaperone IbpA